MVQIIDYVSERLRLIEALKDGTIEPISRLELTIEEGVLLKVLFIARGAASVSA